MEDNIQKLASMGRFEDDQIAHVATGEMIVPPVISPVTRMMIEEDMLNQGMDPNQYIVGGNPSINPRTGLQEFFIKKLFKKVKKIAKKVLPVAGALLIPGVGGVVGKGLSAVGSKLGIKAGLGSKLLGGKGILGTAKTVRGGLGGFARNIFGGGLGGGQQELQQPQFEMILDEDGNPTGMYQEVGIPGSSFSQAELQEAGFIDRDGNFVTPTQTRQETGPLGLPFGPQLRKRFLGDDSQPIFGQQTGTQTGTQTGGGLNLGGAGGLAALAALYGLATKKAAEKTEGGLRDIRLSTRPDLMPQQTFQGFDVGVRPGMLYGGRMDEQELDLRMGGPSEGPGTETSDDIPAMLSDGEFVMTAAANKGLGGFKIEKNKDSLTIFPTGKPDREQGFKNNDMLMKFFEDYQEKVS